MSKVAASVRRSEHPAVSPGPIEWSTVALIVACYGVWLAAGMLYARMPVVATIVMTLTIVLHSSLQHETIHRHPTRHAGCNEALVFLPLGLLVPYRRYRRLHLLHHDDSRLTDPYGDPESFYLSRYDWQRLPRALRTLLAWNNVLALRMLIGPAIAAIGFLLAEVRLQPRNGDRAEIRAAWLRHGIGLTLLVTLAHHVFAMPPGAYLLSAYGALSLLALRSFCEHRWAEDPDGRTVIVAPSILGLLFLNNNLHLVHHRYPGMPWHALPAAYRLRRAEWSAINDGYVFSGYGAVLRAFGMRMKGPVAHPAISLPPSP